MLLLAYLPYKLAVLFGEWRTVQLTIWAQPAVVAQANAGEFRLHEASRCFIEFVGDALQHSGTQMFA